MAKILRKSHMPRAHGPAAKGHTNELKYGKNEDPAKITHSKMAFFSRPCCPCEHEQMQAHRHVHTDRMSLCVSAAQQHGHGQPRH